MTMPDIAKIAAALDAELERRNEYYGLDNWSSEEVVRFVLDRAEPGRRIERADVLGTYVEHWHVPQPEEYVVTRQQWNDDFSVRHIYEVKDRSVRKPQPMRPSPMMGELGHGRPSLLRWLRERKQQTEDEDGWRDYDHGFRDGYRAALREHQKSEVVVCSVCGHTEDRETAKELWCASYKDGRLVSWECCECFHGEKGDNR